MLPQSTDDRLPSQHTLGINGFEMHLLVFDLFVEALAESLGHLEFNAITHQFHDVLGPVQDCRTVGANLEMRFHAGAHLGGDLPVQEIGDLSPDLKAADFYHLHWIRRVPFSFKRLAQPRPTTASPFRTPACRRTSSHQYPMPRHPAYGIVPAKALF